MKVYRRSGLRFIRSAVVLLFAAGLVFAALNFLLRDAAFAIMVSGGAYVLAALCLFLFHGNVRFELEVGRLRYYKTGRLRGNYFLSSCKFRTHIECDYGKAGEIVGRLGLELFVSDVSDYSGSEVKIDCTPIGFARFRKLIDGLRQYYESTAQRDRLAFFETWWMIQDER